LDDVNDQMKTLKFTIIIGVVIFLVSTVYSEGGWYLLKPPVRDDFNIEALLKHYPNLRGRSKSQLHEIAPEFMGNWNAPLSTWMHIGSFDTAKDCESTRIRLMETARAREPELREKYPNGYPSLESTLLRESRCIASNDPRLYKTRK
jgi:hypothetical protein